MSDSKALLNAFTEATKENNQAWTGRREVKQRGEGHIWYLESLRCGGQITDGVSERKSETEREIKNNWETTVLFYELQTAK